MLNSNFFQKVYDICQLIPGINLMQQLLENEGIVVKENQNQNSETVFWDLIKELS